MKTDIDALLREAADNPSIIGLAGGLPSDAQFPKWPLAMSFIRMMKRAGTPALQYTWAEGSERLRTLIAARLSARGASVSATDIIITSGAQQAIAIALELTTKRGDEVAVDAETYPAALELMRFRGLVPVARTRAAACAYAMPVISNPRGQALSAPKKAELLASGMPIIEDDAYAELRFSGPPPAPLLAEAGDRVFHVGTFSKILCPGLRVGWLVVPHHLRQRALDLKQGVDLQASTLAQAIVEDYLLGDATRPGVDLDERLARLRRFYLRRAMVMARAIRRHLPWWKVEFPEGGFAFWVETNLEVPEEELLRAAIAEGVTFDPGTAFRPSPASHGGQLSLRLCFSSARRSIFDLGLRRLARAWERVAPVTALAV